MNHPGVTHNFVAGGAIGANRIVKFGSGDTTVLQATAATESLLGVTTEIAALITERCDVILSGVAEVEYGGVVTRGARLTADADGKAVAASAGNRVIGIAMVSGVSGDIGSVLLAVAGAIDNDQEYTVDVTISTAELLALNATPKQLVAAPGANKALIPTGLTLMLDYNSAAYAGIAAGEDLALCYTNLSGVQCAVVETTGFLDQTADQVRYANPLAASGGFVPAANAALVLGLLTAEIITGDSPLKCRISYKIIDTVL
jgi:hypothetical protein